MMVRTAEREGEHLHHVRPTEGCDWCAVRPLIGDLWRIFDGAAGEAARARLWELQDGNSFGLRGLVGPEGEVWEAIRRSSPDAVIEMWEESYGPLDDDDV